MRKPFFFLGWSVRIPADIIEHFECIGFHCTALPFGRGGAPIENLLLRGYTETVISAFRLTNELDGGPIYAVSPPVSLAGTKAEILQRFVEPCAALMRFIIETEPEPKPQTGPVTIFKRLSPEAYEQFWAARG